VKTNPIKANFRRQTADDGKQMSENKGQITEVYPPKAGQRTACPAGTASNYDMHPLPIYVGRGACQITFIRLKSQG